MTFWRKLTHLIPSVRRAAERDMRDELASLREMAGPGALGNLTLAAEDARAEMTWPSLERLVQDVRYGLRALSRDRLFAISAIATLALGIGANTAIYSFLDSVVLRPLPVSYPDALVVMKWRARSYDLASRGMAWSTGGSSYDAVTGELSSIFPYPALAMFQARTDVLVTAFGYRVDHQLSVSAAGESESLLGHYVSGTYFDGMGVVPAVGRAIQPDDDRLSSAPVAVVSYRFAERRFGSAAAAVGQPIRVNDRPMTIVGVAPQQFFGAEPGAVPDVYVPLAHSEFTASYAADDHFYWLEIMGRMRPDVTPAQAQAQLAPTFTQYAVASATTEKQKQQPPPRLVVEDGATGLDSMRRKYSQPIYVLMTMVGAILLVACMNIASLLLARGTARRREIAVRLSLGASRWRVIRQLLTESALLSLLGGAAGIAFASWGIRLLTSLLANGRDNFTLHAMLDWRVLGVTLVLSIATGIVFGLAPAIQATRVDIAPALKDTPGHERLQRSRRVGLRSALVVAQVAFSLVLLVAAGLFDRTLASLHAIPVGLDREHVLLFKVLPRTLGYDGAAATRLFEGLRERLRQVPGVSDVSLSAQPLPMGGGTLTRMSLDGGSANVQAVTALMSIGPNFFRTLRIPVVSGREFTDGDRAGTPSVVIVNRRFAEAMGVVDPVGRVLVRGKDRFEIVGMVGDVVDFALKAKTMPDAFFPYLQATNGSEGMTYELRTALDPFAVASAVRAAVWAADSRLAVHDMTTQELHIDQEISTEITLARLCSSFAVLALVIACVGLYGTVAFNVARRTHEIGIRTALGASRVRIVWMVLRDVVVMAVLGLAVGLPLVFAGSRYVKSFLYGVAPNDPMSIAGGVAILLGAVLAAAYLPASRASRIDPLIAMRCE